MKNISTSFLLISVISIGLTLKTNAQYADATFNNIVFRVNAEGPLFQGVYRVLGTGNANSIFANSFWIGGTDQNGTYLVTAETFTSMPDYTPGPIQTSYSPDYFSFYNRCWKLTKEQILTHKAEYNQQGYQISPDILDWPGNRVDGTPLAPYFDTNGNGTYDPLNGDYPLIKGDFAVYHIRNDHARPKGSGSSSAQLEFHIMVYGFNSSVEAIKNTVFVNYNIQTPAGTFLNEVFAGVWTDFDLGNPTDNYIGTFKDRNAVYAYNADLYDENGPAQGYGANPPAQGIMHLNSALSSSVYCTRGTGIDGDPQTLTDYYNYLRGMDKSGAYFEQQYAYDGTGGNSEISMANPPGDRRIVANTKIGQFTPGKGACLDMAYVWSRAANGGNIASVQKLYEDLATVQNFYNNIPESCDIFTLGISTREAHVVSLYPNPASGLLYINYKNIAGGAMTEISNICGQTIFRAPYNDHLDVSGLAAGTYMLRIIEGDNYTKPIKFIKQ